MNLKELIQASKKLKAVDVAGITAYIQPISAKDALKNLDWLQSVEKDEANTHATSLEFMCRTVAGSLCDENGKLLVSLDKWKDLEDLEENTLSYLFDVAKGAEPKEVKAKNN